MTKRFDTSGVTYSVDFAPSFGVILTDLCRVVDAVFDKADRYPVLAKQKNPLVEALVGLAAVPDSVYAWWEDTEKLLNALLLHLSAIYTDLDSPTRGKICSTFAMRSHASKLEDLTSSVNRIVNRKFSYSISGRSGKDMTLRFSVLHPDLRSVLTEWQDEVWKVAEEDASTELAAARKQIMDDLHTPFPLTSPQLTVPLMTSWTK